MNRTELIESLNESYELRAKVREAWAFVMMIAAFIFVHDAAAKGCYAYERAYVGKQCRDLERATETKKTPCVDANDWNSQ